MHWYFGGQENIREIYFDRMYHEMHWSQPQAGIRKWKAGPCSQGNAWEKFSGENGQNIPGTPRMGRWQFWLRELHSSHRLLVWTTEQAWDRGSNLVHERKPVCLPPFPLPKHKTQFPEAELWAICIRSENSGKPAQGWTSIQGREETPALHGCRRYGQRPWSWEVCRFLGPAQSDSRF